MSNFLLPNPNKGQNEPNNRPQGSHYIDSLPPELQAIADRSVDLFGFDPKELNDFEKMYEVLRVVTEQGRLYGQSLMLRNQITELRKIGDNAELRAMALFPQYKIYTDPRTGWSTKLDFRTLGEYGTVLGMVDFSSNARVYVAEPESGFSAMLGTISDIPDPAKTFGAIALQVEGSPENIFKTTEQYDVPQRQANAILSGLEYFSRLVSWGNPEPYILDSVPLSFYPIGSTTEDNEVNTVPPPQSNLVVSPNQITNPVIEQLIAGASFNRPYNTNDVEYLLGGQFKRSKAMGLADLVCRHILMSGVYNDLPDIKVGILMNDEMGLSTLNPNYKIGTPFYDRAHDTVDLMLYREDPLIGKVELFSYEVSHLGHIGRFSWLGSDYSDPQIVDLKRKFASSVDSFEKIFRNIFDNDDGAPKPKQLPPQAGGASIPFMGMGRPLFQRFMYRKHEPADK